MRNRRISDRAVEFILARKIEELKNLRTGKIAESIGINRFYLSLRFLIDQKITLPRFILREKMHEAWFILGEGNGKSIDELSNELGFPNVEDFDIEFEKYFSINPAKFREIKNKVPCLRVMSII